MKPRDQWGPRTCPRCGAEPWVYCKSESGRKANLPHKERWPEGPARVYGKERARQREARVEAAEREVHRSRSHLPLGLALKAIDRAHMDAFRESRAA